MLEVLACFLKTLCFVVNVFLFPYILLKKMHRKGKQLMFTVKQAADAARPSFSVTWFVKQSFQEQ